MSCNVEKRRRKWCHYFEMLKQMCIDVMQNKSSVVLFLLTWPMAIVLIIFAHVKRIWAIGNAYRNVSHLVNVEDPTVMDPVLTLSASELGRRIRDPDDPLTSIEVVDACFRQIKRTNPYTQAVVAVRVEKARQEAMRADMAVQEGTVPETCAHFWGVPIVVKECFEVVGLPYTAGLYGRMGVVGTKMCATLAQLQEREGAIIIASTNVSEACMYHESVNHIYGCTYNPYDFRRTAGGSSGGCGAAVASCCAPFAVTSDVGGSTRIPALYNGLFGHKPTGGAVSNDDCMPHCGTGDIRLYCQLGPTSRHAEDLWPLLQAMLQDGAPVHGMRHITEDCITLDLNHLEVFVCKRNLVSRWFSSNIHADVLAGIDKTATYLAARGATLRFDLEEQQGLEDMFSLANAFQVWGCLMSYHKHKPFCEVIREGLPVVSFWSLQVLASLFDLTVNTFPAVGLAVLEAIFDMRILDGENRRFREMGHRLKDSLHDLLAPSVRPIVMEETEARDADIAAKKDSNSSNGRIVKERIIIMPSLPTPAPLHGESLLRILDTANTGFFNIMQLPATAVPFGLEKNHGGSGMHMPVGCQIIGGHGRDAITIAIAVELEKAGIAKWMPPTETHHPFGLHY